MWERVRFEPQEFIPVGGGQVVVPIRIITVGRGGVETVARAASVFSLRDGKVIRLKNFQSKADALAALELPE